MTKSELEELVLELREQVDELTEFINNGHFNKVDEDSNEVDYCPYLGLEAAEAVLSFSDWETTYEGICYWGDE